jgi:hypothetical protein
MRPLVEGELREYPLYLPDARAERITIALDGVAKPFNQGSGFIVRQVYVAWLRYGVAYRLDKPDRAAPSGER